MKINKLGTSIVESLVVMLIIVTGVTGMYNIYIQSINLADSTENRINAIQIARDGIEAMINIRDTNWLLYSSDYKNCWNVADYKTECVADTSTDKKDYDIDPGSYTIYKGVHNRFYLSGTTTGNYSEDTYRTEHRVSLDSDGFYTQSGGTEFKPIFTREIKLTYPDDTDSNGTNDSNDEKMLVKSIVQWADNSGNKPHKVELETILTNWENKKEN